MIIFLIKNLDKSKINYVAKIPPLAVVGRDYCATPSTPASIPSVRLLNTNVAHATPPVALLGRSSKTTHSDGSVHYGLTPIGLVIVQLRFRDHMAVASVEPGQQFLRL